jgi:hypothetical protein
LYGHHRFGGVGALEYRAYGGTFHAEPPPPRNGITTQNLRMPYVWGGRLMWETPLAGLRAGGSFQSLRFDYELQFAPELAQVFQLIELLPPDYIDPLSVEFRVKRWVASLEYQTGDLLLASEYSRWTGEFESIAPKLLRPRTLNERYYVMAAYRVNSWFTPAAYYSVYYPNVHQRRGFHSYQRDLALSFRYDLNQHWLMKIEGHWMHGTADLDPSLNDGKEPDQLTKDWAALLVKTTAYF